MVIEGLIWQFEWQEDIHFLLNISLFTKDIKFSHHKGHKLDIMTNL